MIAALRRFAARFFALFRSRSAEAELQREIAAHLRLLEDDYRVRGLSPEEARFAARRAFGGVAQVQERQRETRSFVGVANWWLDLKLGGRMLMKYPGLTAVGGLALALGIALGAFGFEIAYGYLNPLSLPLPDATRLVTIDNYDLERHEPERQMLYQFQRWREASSSLQEWGASRTVGRNLLSPNGRVETITVAEINAAGLRAARIPPLLGRLFDERDEVVGAPDVVIIGHDVWQQRFQGDPLIVGRELRIGARRHTVVGVMPAGFGFPLAHRFWLPLRMSAIESPPRTGPALHVFARLAPGFTREQAQVELQELAARDEQLSPLLTRLQPRVRDYSVVVIDDMRQWEIRLMHGLVSLVLVVIGVNVAVLVYARTTRRQGELAVRTALGASRGRIVTQLFCEALVLALVAAAAGLLLTQYALWQLEPWFAAQAPFWFRFRLSPGVIGYAFAAAVACAVVVGVTPALKATGRGMHNALQRLSVDGTGVVLGKTWTLLIVVQVALAVAALPAALHFAREAWRFSAAQADGVEPHVLVGRLVFDRDSEGTPAPEISARTELLRRLAAHPEVRGVALSLDLPGAERSVAVELSAVPGASIQQVGFARVDLKALDVLGVKLLAGRSLQRSDAGTAATGVIVNRSFADEFFAGNALGRRIRYVTGYRSSGVIYEPVGVELERWYEVVGVVEDFPRVVDPVIGLHPRVYHAMDEGEAGPLALAIRLNAAPAPAFIEEVRNVAGRVDARLRFTRLLPLDQLWKQDQSALRTAALAFGLATASVLMLSAAGIYAMMSFVVAQRRREVGIRLALGADRRQLIASIFARAARQLGWGIAIGTLLAIGLDWKIDGQPVLTNSPFLFPIVALLMLAIGLAASIGPARRAVRIDPIETLRAE